MDKQDTVTGKNRGDNYCYYYLHTNGDLIHKSKHYDVSGFKESSFVSKWWIIDLDKRLDVYNMLIHASRLGIKEQRLSHLIKHWGITNEDAVNYCNAVGLLNKMDGNAYCVHGQDFTKTIQESIAGFGETLFQAICDFYKNSLAEGLVLKPELVKQEVWECDDQKR